MKICRSEVGCQQQVSRDVDAHRFTATRWPPATGLAGSAAAGPGLMGVRLALRMRVHPPPGPLPGADTAAQPRGPQSPSNTGGRRHAPDRREAHALRTLDQRESPLGLLLRERCRGPGTVHGGDRAAGLHRAPSDGGRVCTPARQVAAANANALAAGRAQVPRQLIQQRYDLAVTKHAIKSRGRGRAPPLIGFAHHVVRVELPGLLTPQGPRQDVPVLSNFGSPVLVASQGYRKIGWGGRVADRANRQRWLPRLPAAERCATVATVRSGCGSCRLRTMFPGAALGSLQEHQ